MKTIRLLACGSLWSLLLALPSTQALAADGWGASWSFGPVHPTTSNHIIYTKTTLVPGRLPTWPSGSGPLFIWPGLSNPTSDLIQTTGDAWGDNASACGAKTGQWCLEASVFGSFGQRSGPSVSIDPDDHITIEYKLGSDNNTWTQTVTSMKLGKVVSTLTSTSGLMLGGGFGFATEADADSYTIDTQYYLCTEIHLAAADTAFGKTGVGGIGAKMGATGTGSGIGTIKNLHTPDNGLTWLADSITLPAMNPSRRPRPRPPRTTAGPAAPGGTTGTGGGTRHPRQLGQRWQGEHLGERRQGRQPRQRWHHRQRRQHRNRRQRRQDRQRRHHRHRWQHRQRREERYGRRDDRHRWHDDRHGRHDDRDGRHDERDGRSQRYRWFQPRLRRQRGGGNWRHPGQRHRWRNRNGARPADRQCTTDGSSGCSCVVGSRSPRGEMSAFLLLGALALLARRRRNRS